MDLDLSRPELPSDYTFYTESATIGIFLVIGLIANCPLVFIYVRSKHIRSVADKFLFNILITDVLSLFILLPMILMDLILNHRDEENTSNEELVTEDPMPSSGSDFPSTWSCTFKKSFLSGVATASILAALEIAVERYLVIVTPLHYHKLLTRPAVVITSIVGVLIAIGSAILSSLDPCEPVFPSCAKTTITYTESLWWPTYTLIHVSVFFILPVFLMAFIYMRIWCEARRQIAKINEQCKNPFFLSDHQQIREHPEKGGKRGIHFYPTVIRTKIMNRLKLPFKTDRAARVSILTLSATIICWSPYYYVQCAHAIRSIMEQMGGNFKVLEAWNHWETTLPLIFAGLHPVLEPFFYAYRYKRLREEVAKFLKCAFLRQFLFRSWNTNAIEKTPNLIHTCSLPPLEDITKPISRVHLPPCIWTDDRPRFHIGDFENESMQGDIAESVITTADIPCDSLSPNGINAATAAAVAAAVNLDEKRMTDTIGLKATLYWVGSTTRQCLHCLSEWVSSYSKRWRSHRESVTSTSSVVTLLSSRWSSEIPPAQQV